MAIDFGKLGDKIANEIIDKLQSGEQPAKQAGDQVIEAFGKGIEDGMNDVVNKITGSSVKINKAFKDLATRIKTQKEHLATLIGKEAVVIDVDFSKIDVDSKDFKSKVDNAFKNFKVDNPIEFDTKASETQFKNILKLYMKYGEKLNQLQTSAPRLTDSGSKIANAQEQLVLIDALKEIQTMINGISGMSIKMPRIFTGDVKEIRTKIAAWKELSRAETKGEEAIAKKRKTHDAKLQQKIKEVEAENKELAERNKILEEKAALVKDESKTPAKKPRGRKPKAEVPAIDTLSSKMSFTDGTPLDDKETKMVTKYLDIMKKKMGENYKEAEHLKAALDLVFDVKHRNIEKIMGRFTNGNDASNAVLNMATEMPVNNQKNRDTALRSLNTEEYDRIIAERKSAMSKDKTDFQKKWEELASVMLGGDAFKDDSNLVKGKVAKAFEELGVTAKDGIEKINKMWLAGELEGKTFQNKYIQSYVNHLNDQTEYYTEMGKSQAGDIDMDGLFNGQADLKLTEEKAQALRDEAAAYDELIAKKKEYYGIKGTAEFKEDAETESLKKQKKELEIIENIKKRIISERDRGNYDGQNDFDIRVSIEELLSDYGIHRDTNDDPNGQERLAKQIYSELFESNEAGIDNKVSKVVAKSEVVEEQVGFNLDKQAEETGNVVQLVDNYDKALDEVNNKLMQGTKLLNEQGKIIRLFHNSPEIFDEFDISKAGTGQGQALGKGNYLALHQGGEFNSPEYGRYQTQWYADVQNPFNTRDSLTFDQSTSVIEKFIANEPEEFKRRIISELTDGDVIGAIKDIADIAKVEVGEIFSHIGYDAVMDGAQINVFDPAKIHRANDSILDTGASDFEAYNDLYQKVLEERKIISRANSQIEKLSNKYSGQTEDELQFALDIETMSKGFGWRDNVAKIGSAFKELTGELPKSDEISEETMSKLVENYEFTKQNIQGYQDEVAKHEAILNELLPQLESKKIITDNITKSYLDGNIKGIVNKDKHTGQQPQTHETESEQTSLLSGEEPPVKPPKRKLRRPKQIRTSEEKFEQIPLNIDGAEPKIEADVEVEPNEPAKAIEEAVKKGKEPVIKTKGSATFSEDGEGGKNIWTTPRSGESLDTLNLPVRYKGENGQDAVQMFAGLKSQIEEMTGKPVTIDFSSNVNEDGQLEAIGATLKYVNEEAGVTVKQFYDIERSEDGILIATQSYEKATLSATKAAKNFNAEMQRKVAEAQIKTLETQMGSLELNLTNVKQAAADINDQASLDKFNLELKAAKEEAKQLKAELKGQNALDTIASMERSALALPSELERIKRKLEELGNVDGAEAVSNVLKSVEEEYHKFLTTDKSEDKTKAFRSLSTSMTWIKAEMKDLTDKNSKLKQQETKVEKAELAKQKAAREAYIDWWKATLNEQSKEESAVAARNKQEQSYSDWWNKALHEREQKEKAKDERVIEARKKKEASYEAWWQKQFKLQDIAEQKKADKPYIDYGKTTANAALRKQDQLQGQYDALEVTNPNLETQMETYKQKVQEVINLRNQFANDPNAAKDPALVRQFQKVSYEAEQARKNIKTVLDEEARMAQMSDEQGFLPKQLLPEEMADYESKMIALAREAKGGRVQIQGWNADHTKLNYTVTNAKGTVQEMTIALGEGTNTMYQYRTATKETGTAFERFMNGIRVKAKEISTFILGGGSIYKLISIGREGIRVVRDIDIALTELKKVTDETEETYEKFLDTASKTAAKVGSTIKDVISSTADWARLGYSMEQAAKFAESTQILMNVSEFTDVSRATDTLISSVQAFGYTAETSMEVVDLLNTIGKIIAYR